jgi:peptidoglycan hydrolase-like protein with peptidoglycan-binding domain
MRPSRGVLGWLPVLLLTACVASQTQAPTAARPAALTQGSERPALDRLLTRGDIQIAEEHLQAFGFDPGPVDGIFTAQTQAAVRAFQARYGLPVSGLLDRATREELQLGVGAKGGN